MKKAIIWLFLSVLLCGCGAQQKHTEKIRMACQEPNVMISAETVDLQRKLAMWYNLNIRSDNPDPGFEESYNRILYLEDGLMGYVALSNQEGWIPIYHDHREDGFYLDPKFGFPIGGFGNCAKLHIQENLDMQFGDLISVFVLNECLTYQVGLTCGDSLMLVCGDGVYEAGRVDAN